MHRNSYFPILIIACAVALTACGGNSSSPGQVIASQAKQLHRSEKTEASDYSSELQELYVAYYGRPADPAGLAYWEGVLLAQNAPTDLQSLNSAYSSNASVKAVVDSFGNSAESQALYGTGNVTAFVTAIYNNALGRAPDTAGLNYWVGLISTNKVTQAQAAIAIIAGAAAEPSTSSDEQLVSNRLTVATYFTSQVASQNAAQVYSGSAANATVRTMLDGVTSTTNTAAYESNVGATVTSLFGNLPNLSLVAGNTAGQGSINGTGMAATFANPGSVAVDSAGNIYVADAGNHLIRKISPAGVATTFAGTSGVPGSADGIGTEAGFFNPSGIAIDTTGNIYVADTDNQTIRKISPAGVVSTLAGSAGVMGSADGSGAAASFYYPYGVAVDNAGNVYVADTMNDAIRKITPLGQVSTLASSFHLGNIGSGAPANISQPKGVAVDSQGFVYVAETGGDRILYISPAGAVSVLAGEEFVTGSSTNNNVSPAQGLFSAPSGIAVDNLGNIYIADSGNNMIREISASPGSPISTLAGAAGSPGSADGNNVQSRFNNPQGIAFDSVGNLYIADTGNNTIRKYNPSNSGGQIPTTSTIAGTAGVFGSTDGIYAAASFNNPYGVTTDSAGNVYVADTHNNIIRKITPSGEVTTLAGTAGVTGSADGTGAAASFNQPYGIAVDNFGNVYVADTWNCMIRKISPAGVVTTLAGTSAWGSNDGTGAAAGFNLPFAVATDSLANVYVADTSNNTIRKVTPAGVVTTVAGTAGVGIGSTDGTGAAARFYQPTGIAVDGAGNLYVADSANTVRKITPAGVVTTLAGTPGVFGNVDGTGAEAQFSSFFDVAVDSIGNVYVADTNNSTIRKITPAGVVTTVVGVAGQAGFVAGVMPAGLAFPTGLAINGRSLYTTTNNGIVVINNIP